LVILLRCAGEGQTRLSLKWWGARAGRNDDDGRGPKNR
jgi:hypothetical protein